MVDGHESLFSEVDLHTALEKQLEKAVSYVPEIPKDQFLNSGKDAVIEHVISKYKIAPLEIYEDRMQVEVDETTVEVSSSYNRIVLEGTAKVPGVVVTVEMPYSGESKLWRMRLHEYQARYPQGKATERDPSGYGTLRLVFRQPADVNQEEVKRELESRLRDIRSLIDDQRGQLTSFHERLDRLVSDAVTARLSRLNAHDGIVQILGIPLKRRPGMPELQPLPLKKRLVQDLQPPPKGGFRPEPGVTDTDNEEILRVIRYQGRSLEKTPSAVAALGEEQLRDLVISTLNTHYVEQVTGETFRKTGKTDICIQATDRMAFVAECKLWSGAKVLESAIDQLLSYLTWRDCKTALILFNKRVQSMSTLLESVPKDIVSHAKTVQQIDLDPKHEGEWRFKFRQGDDEERFLILHVFLFHLYAKGS